MGNVTFDADSEEFEKEIYETTQQTKAELYKIVNRSLRSSHSKFIKYKPSQHSSAAFNSGANERIIRMVVMPVEPLEPPKFRHKRVPNASGSPPLQVLRSPPRSLTVKDQQDWKIPPCVSNWKNPKGFTIPLDKRLAADGRGIQEFQINVNFAKVSEALYVAEQKAREAIAMRSKVEKEMVMKEKERKVEVLRTLAQRARSERADAMEKEEREAQLKREKILEERRRERERERRLEAKDTVMGKKRKMARERERHVEFEKEEVDPFGLDQFLTEVKKGVV